jgi:pimeloyl-ACP methyl ester carboxylesterase
MSPESKKRLLKIFTWRRMVLRFLYPLNVLFASKKKVDRINENSIRAAQLSQGTITIFLHGIFSTYYSAPYWALTWFKRNGIQVVSVGYNYNADAETAGMEVKTQIEAIMARTGIRKINIVGVSLGGGVARYYIEKLGGKEVVDKLVTVFTPIGESPPGTKDIAYLMNLFASKEAAEKSREQVRAVAHTFSVRHHLAIYGANDWIVGKGKYPLRDVPMTVTQVCIAGGHLFCTYNVDAFELALSYLLEIPYDQVTV